MKTYRVRVLPFSFTVQADTQDEAEEHAIDRIDIDIIKLRDHIEIEEDEG